MGVIQVSGKDNEVRNGQTIQQAVSELGLHPDSYLYLVDGKPVPMDTVIADGMVVKAMRVASGG
jgi:sulfur carrier protein